MNIIKVLAGTIGVFMLAIYGAPFVLGMFIVASAGSTSQGRAAIGAAAVLSDKDVQRKIIERSIARNAEAASQPSGSFSGTSYSSGSGSNVPFVPAHRAEPGQPMLDPKPSR